MLHHVLYKITNNFLWNNLFNLIIVCRNQTDDDESKYTSLSLHNILPIPAKSYDKNQAPKLLGQATVVYFHVTVLSLDSINEESMVCQLYGNY